MGKRNPQVGEHVIFVDEQRVERDALVSCVHGDYRSNRDELMPSINIVQMDPNEGAEDSYGRQIVHKTSVPYISDQGAGGFCWKFPACEADV